jgi:methylase of polypeptide subunit release factors
MAEKETRTYEVTFCSRVAGWANELFHQHPEWPFRRAEIEQSNAIQRKRSDLRIYGEADKLLLAGEVKMPGTRQGITPYNPDLIADSAAKADNAGAEFFFTWNVNDLVLFDRKKWQLPLMERRVEQYALGLALESDEEIDRVEVATAIKKFVGDFFEKFAAILAGRQPGWGMRLDEWFIRSFESHISWPVKLTAAFLGAQAEATKAFDHRLQDWLGREQGWLYARHDQNQWREILDRAARTLCYVFANRLIFYESVRAKFPELAELTIPQAVVSASQLYSHFQKTFQKAVEATGDYETLFYPFENDWAGPLIFGHADAAEAWRSVLQNLQPFNFKLIPTDVLGGIFRRIIDPEERHKFGQHYTNEDLVDVVNAFCVRHAEDNVLDPTCGSGSFLVRAYQRKAWLKQDFRLTHCAVTHQDRLAQLYGVDISVFAAHLATLNLAARDINDEENYPRIRRGNFFEVAAEAAKNKPFCTVPQGLQGSRAPGPVALPPLQAIVGNPPYVRQELIPRRGQSGARPMSAKEDLMDFCAQAWPGLKLSGRSDLHCYFWPAAARFLTEGGWFGFLVSSSWLDVEYGFALQEWVLSNFRLHAILESNAEPWFEDARVKTCAVILQRCANAATREAQLVKFIRLDAPLRSILGERPDENARQAAAEKFHEKILACKKNVARDGWRAVVRMQKELWEDGLRAGRLFELQKQRDLAENVKAETGVEEEDEAEGPEYDGNGNGKLHEISPTGYGGGKWGKYLRAPNLYFRIMERYAGRFVPLGEIATIRFGVKSGCDAFFMPRDVSAEYLEKYSKLDWNNAPLMTHCKRAEVESGVVKLIQAGDQTVHPVEAQYLAPEVHSLMNISRPEILAKEIDRFILLVSDPMASLRGTYVQKYLRYGERHSFASKKSRAVPVPRRSTCASRDPWYDLTNTRPGALFWPMAQQYRHVIPVNPEGLICNHNLFDIHPFELSQEQVLALQAVLNSTLLANFKTFYGRYAGTEGNLKTEVVDVNLLEVPDPRHATKAVARKLRDAFEKLRRRDTRPMVEEEFMACHSAERAKKLAEKAIALPAELQMPDRRALDLAVFELLGVAGAREREALCDELYLATAAHFRQIRVVEIQKQEQRAGATGREFRTDELAADLWDGLAAADKQSLTQWLSSRTTGGKPHAIPEGHATLPDSNDFLDANTVFFRQSISGKAVSKPMPLPSRSHAEIVFKLAQLGLHGGIRLPESPGAARELKEHLESRLAGIEAKAGHLAQSRAGDERKAADVAGLLRHWMIHGKPHKEPSDPQTT